MVARVWTKKECKQTLQEGIYNGFTVVKKGEITKIMDGDILIVSWLKMGKTFMVRLNEDYFEV